MIPFNPASRVSDVQAKALIYHAIGLMLRHPKDTVRVTVLPYLLAQVLPSLIYASADQTGPMRLSVRVAAELCFLAGMAWMAVAWHRYILSHETGWPLPPAPPGRVMVYLGYLAAFEAAVMVASFVLMQGLAVLILGGAGGWALQVPIYLGLFAASVLFGRLGAILPAVALGPVQSSLDGWRATRGATLTIALACAALFLLEEAVFRFGTAFPLDPQVAQLLQAALQWPVFLLGIALLTSTYLRYVKGQPLD